MQYSKPQLPADGTAEYKDFKQDVEDNYRPVSYKEQLGED